MIIQGDCLEEMRKMEDNSIDFVVCDPPYGLFFMGKNWDGRVPGIEYWQEAIRIAKPGAMLAAFGGSRTHHHLMIALEGAGWEIRDVIMWIYGSGFPKSMDISKAIDKKLGLERKVIGIKPGHEACFHNRIHHLNNGWKRPWASDPEKVKLYHSKTAPNSDLAKIFEGYSTALKPAYEPIIICQKPCEGTFAENAHKWGVAGINIEESRIGTTRRLPASLPKSSNGIGFIRSSGKKEYKDWDPNKGRWPANVILDEEAAKQLGFTSCFFYCAKSSPRERGEGNNHPCVKPLSLMKYILKLLAPPGDPICLDPFAGSGSTLVAAKELGIRCIGIEREPEYCEIARKRLEAA